MVEVPFQQGRVKRKSTATFLMTLPLIFLIAILVICPAFYSLHLATLNKSMSRFIGLGNFEFLFKRDTFWLTARHVAGALGHSGRDEHAGMAVAVRPVV